MNHWLGLRTISPLLFVWLLLFLLAGCGGEPTELVVIGGVTVPEEGSRIKPVLPWRVKTSPPLALPSRSVLVNR